MASSTREDIVDSVDALDADLDRLCGLSFDVLTTPERLRVLERLETAARRLRVPGHALINQLAEQAGDEESGGRPADALCGLDNRLAEKGWTTRKNARGDTEWIPPPHLKYGQPRVNTFHHPEKLLAPDEEPGAA